MASHSQLATVLNNEGEILHFYSPFGRHGRIAGSDSRTSKSHPIIHRTGSKKTTMTRRTHGLQNV